MNSAAFASDVTGYALPDTGPYRRIVSLVPSLTELLVELGAPVVGRTRYCVHPAEAVAGIPIVGGTKDFDLAKIRALNPDLVIANLEENVAEPLLALREEIPVWTTQVRDLPEALTTIVDLGRLSGREPRARQLAADIDRAFAALSQHPPRRVLYLIWRRPWMSVGNDTFIHDLIRRCGWINSMAEHTRYPSLDDHELAALEPELILLSSEPYPFAPKHLPELQSLCPDARLALVDGSYFSWYGSRLLPAAAYLLDLSRSF